MEAADSSSPTAASRVAVRLPPFLAEWPAAWFAQAEAQFFLAGISSETTKFYYVISQLEHRYATEVEDIITSLPERDPCTTLRTELVRRLCPSREQRIHQLLTLGEMGDRKAVLVSEASQEPCPRRVRRLDPKHLVQPATHAGQHKGSADRISQIDPSRRPLVLAHPQRRACCYRGSKTSPARWLQSEPSKTVFAPASGTLTPAPATQAPAPGILIPAPGPAARAADPQPEMTLHPALVGITATSGPEHKSVLLPATTASRVTDAADIIGGTCLLYNKRPPLHHG
jgi:hypothetical protein